MLIRLLNNKIDFITQDYIEVTSAGVEVFAPLKNDTIVITGGTGFMGTWIVGLLAFLNDHHSFNMNIILVARQMDHFKLQRPHLANRNDIKLISADVRHFADLPMDTNWIIHAAATPDNRVHATRPLETMSVIANGTHSILRAAERCSNFKMLLNISSGLIYGSQPLLNNALQESHAGAPLCGTVTSAYAEAKRYAETLCAASRSEARMPVMTVRPFAFIGPYQSLERPWAINNFINDALSGRAIRIMGDGNTIRSYLYASDMAYWILTMLVRGQAGETYNLGSDEEIDLKTLAEMVSAKLRGGHQIQLRVGNGNQASRFIPDLSFAAKQLHLTRTVDLDTALTKTIAWHQL